MSRVHMSLSVIAASVCLLMSAHANADDAMPAQPEATTSETVTTQGSSTAATTPDEKVVTTTTTESKDGGDMSVTKTTRHVVVTSVPAAKEVIATPQGYVDCFMVSAGWHHDMWVPEHKICQYENSAEGVAWIEGYWGCNKATSDGVCTNWEWKSGHWEKTLAVY